MTEDGQSEGFPGDSALVGLGFVADCLGIATAIGLDFNSTFGASLVLGLAAVGFLASLPVAYKAVKLALSPYGKFFVGQARGQWVVSSLVGLAVSIGLITLALIVLLGNDASETAYF